MACFIHKRTRIVGGGPVGILDGSWMVSIQRGYADAVNILHLLLPPLKKNSPAPASGPDQPWMDNVSAELFLPLPFSVSFQKPVKMRWFVLGKACKHFTHLSDSRGCWTGHRLICYNIPNCKKPVTRKSLISLVRQKSSEDLLRQTPESWCTFSKTPSGMF